MLLQAKSAPVAAARPNSRISQPVQCARLPLCPAPRRLRRCVARRPLQPTILCSAISHPGEEAAKEEGFNPQLSIPDVSCAKGGGGGQSMGSGGSLGTVLEKSKMDFVMPTPPVTGPKLDDSGSGGDIGKINVNGGGGGGGDDGDDDDYFNEEGDGDGEGGEGQPEGFFRTKIPESYDRLHISAVLSEWYKTVAELPLILRRAVEMGLFSSAQLVRFCSMDVRPGVTRAVSRSLPASWSREFVGRLMADPAFVQKLFIEQVLAATSSIAYEWHVRGENFKKELDLVAINTVGLMAGTAATVWILTPSRSYGAVHKLPWQQMLSELPNCVFDSSGPLRNYTRQARMGGFFARMAELSAVGVLTGTATSMLGSAAVALRQRQDPSWQPSVPVPDVARASGGMGAYFALNVNTRYQLIGGMDRYLFDHTTALWTYLGFSTVGRAVSNRIGELSRPWWQGLPTQRPRHNEPQPQKRRVRRRRAERKAEPVPEAAAVSAPLSAAAAVDLASTAAPLSLSEVHLSTAGEAAAAGVSSAASAGVSGDAVSAEADASTAVAPGTFAMLEAASHAPVMPAGFPVVASTPGVPTI